VTAGDGDLDGGSREVLAADLGHVDGGGASWRCAAGGRCAQYLSVAQRGEDLAEVAHGMDRDAIDDLGLGGARVGDDDAAHAGGAREHRRREGTAHGAHGAVEPELPEDEEVGERAGSDHALAGEDREGDGQIEAGAGLA
jgi:hypothetical protein